MQDMWLVVLSFVSEYYIPIIITYVIGGALYAVLKWTILIVKLRGRVSAIDDVDIKLFLAGATAYKDKDMPFILQRMREKRAFQIFDKLEYPPQASSNKGNLLMWAIFWPFNLVYTMFADVAKSVWEFLYNKFGSVLQSIANSILPK